MKQGELAICSTAFDILDDLLVSTPLSRHNRHLVPPIQGTHQLVESSVLLYDWQLHSISSLESAMKATLARIARTLYAAVSTNGEIVMLPLQPHKDNEHRICSPARGIDLSIRFVPGQEGTMTVTFRVLYAINDTAERAKVEWFQDLLEYSLAEA